MSHEMTTEEVSNAFLEHISMLVDFWEKESRAPTLREKMEGLVHSILAELDGCSATLPAFIVAPDPHIDDEEYRRENEQDWFPYNGEFAEQIKANISGGMHEMWHKVRERYSSKS
jgi:hypothetical protein